MKPKTKKFQTLHDKEMYVKRGGDLRVFTKAEINELEELALDVKDCKLYDALQLYYQY